MPTKEAIEKPKQTKRVDPTKVLTNHLMAILTWVKVEKNEEPVKPKNYFQEDRQRTLVVNDLDKSEGKQFRVIGEDLISNMFSADTWLEFKEVNLTELATTFTMSYNVPFTVIFDKEEDKNGNRERRVLRGRLIKADPLFGKSLVEDLDKPANDRLRWIKHDSLKGLICQGVKSVLKGSKV